MLKKRNGFTFDENAEKHAATSDSSVGLKKVLRYTNRKYEQPEDILADSIIFRQEKSPVWKRKRFHFIIGLSVGLLAAYGASTTPVAQTHINELQSYLALQIADMDLAKMIPVTDLVDEIFGNVTSFFTPVPSSDQAFMPALTYKYVIRKFIAIMESDTYISGKSWT
jgi:phospholipid:diacylglycerol acyltransferase